MVNKKCIYVSQEEGVEKQLVDGFEYVITKTKRKIITELVVGKQYRLQYSGQFCHFTTTSQIDRGANYQKLNYQRALSNIPEKLIFSEGFTQPLLLKRQLQSRRTQFGREILKSLTMKRFLIRFLLLMTLYFFNS